MKITKKQKFRACYVIFFAMLAGVSPSPNHAYANNSSTTSAARIMDFVATGTVLDDTGSPLTGATVVVQGSSRGVVTDMDGKFSIEVSEGEVLVVSFIGMITKQITIENEDPIEITLASDATLLGDVVVVGYGVQKKSETTSSISQVSGEDIETTTASNVAMSLQGRASGVEFVTSGLPGRTPSIRIRGAGSINNTQPLIVLDGVPVSADILGQLAPSEIESIEILKDAASGAIYGTRAANGVVLITTKNAGFDKKMSVRLNASAGVNSVINKYPVLNAEQLWELKRERYTMDGLPIDENSPWADEYYGVTRTDWQDEMFRNGLFTDYNVNIGGGSENASVNANISYRNEEGTLITTYMERLAVSLKSTQKITDKLRIEESVRVSGRSNQILQDDEGGAGTSETIYSAYRFMPSIPVRYEDGSYGSGRAHTQLGDMWNPVYKAEEEWWRTNEVNTLISAMANYDLSSALTLTARASYQRVTREKDRFQDITPDQSRSVSAPTLDYRDYLYTTKIGEVFANYAKQFGDHNLGLTFGVSGQIDQSEWSYMSGQGFANTDDNQLVMSNATNIQGEGSEYPSTGLASAFVRATYNLRDKYYASGIFRADGSSRFDEGNRWGYFPAISGAWRISEEGFLADNPIISNMKLNVGWGQLGNQNVDPFQYLNVYQKDVRYILGGETLTGTRLASFANRDITWETTSTLNILLEMGFFNDKLNLNVAYFDRRTKDMLIPLPSLLATGLVSIPDSNVGEMRNNGFEIEPSYYAQIGDVTLDVGINATILKNEVTTLYGEAQYLSTNDYNRTYEGQPIGAYYGWQTDGIYQNQSEIENDPNISNDPRITDITPGDIRFVDVNGDHIVDDQDRVQIGDPNPNFLLGFNLGVSYKGFNLSTVFSGTFGNQLYDAMMMRGIDPTQSGNMDQVAYQRWTGEGTSNQYPRMSTIIANNNYRVSQLGVKDGDYLRMKDVTLSYSLSNDAVESIGLSNLKFYLSGRNLLTFTNYDGVDPEESGQDNLNRGIILNNTPQYKSMVFGIDVTF